MADLDEESQEETTYTAEEALALALSSITNVLSARQSEVLRVAQFIEERQGELNDARARAKRRIEQQLQEVDEDIFEGLLRVFGDLQKEAIESDGDLSTSDRAEALRAAVEEIFADLPEGIDATYASSILSSLRPSIGTQFLTSSLLVTLVGELEMFINQLARIGFEFRPGALLGSEQTFTWKEISVHESMDEFRDYVVDQTVESLLRGSLTKWTKFFERKFGLSEIQAASRPEALEAVQRRHCIVHNAGTVSSQYLAELGSAAEGVEIDDELPVSMEYLNQAADSLYLVSFSLVWALGMKLVRETPARNLLLENLSNRTMFLLQEGRFDLVILIADAVPHEQLSLDPDGESCSLIIKVNRWLAFKEKGNFDAVEAEVRGFPVRNLAERFKMAKAALLDDVEEAFMYAERLMAAGELKEAHVLTWPLLRGVRAHMRNIADSQGP